MGYTKHKWVVVFSVGFILGMLSGINGLGAAPAPEGSEDTITLPLNEEHNIQMTEFIDFVSDTLDISLLYQPAEVNDLRIMFSSEVRIPRSKLQGFVERLFLEYEFLLLVSGEGESAIYSLRRISPAGLQRRDLPSKLVALENASAYADRGILITVTVPLKWIDARGTMAAMQSYFWNQQLETFRPIENSNAVLITAVAHKVVRVIGILQQMDVPGSTVASPPLIQRIQALEDRIARLEKALPSR